MLKGFLVTSFGRGKAIVVPLVLGFTVRLIPEVLSYPHPIGFDTIYYAARIKEEIIWYHWSSAFSTWLFYAISILTYRVTRMDSFVLLKLMAPLLFGLNVSGVHFFAQRVLRWDAKKSLLAALVFSFQMAALGISWQYYRNMLGLGLLLFTLSLVGRGLKTKVEILLFILLSVLVVFSHELASVALFTVVLGIAVKRFLGKAKLDAFKILMVTLPAFVVFLISIYFLVFPVSVPQQRDVIRVFQREGHYQGAFFFFTNYLEVYDTVQHYPSYLDLIFHSLSLFGLLYLPILPLVLVGFFRNSALDSWSVLLLAGSFGALVIPFFALDMWHRWMLMLVYPFTFYAANAIVRVVRSNDKVVSSTFRFLRWMRLSKRTVKFLLLLSLSFGLIFMATPMFSGKFGAFGLPTTVSYLPSTMLSNTVPLQDVDGTVKAMEWLNEKMEGNSVLLAHDAFFSWARLYLDNSRAIVYFKNDVKKAINASLNLGFDSIYLVWWNEDIGWYGFAAPDYFVPVRVYERVAVFRYDGAEYFSHLFLSGKHAW